VVNNEFKTLSSLDENICLETFEIVIVCARHFNLPNSWKGELSEHFDRRDLAQSVLQVQSRHELVLVLELLEPIASINPRHLNLCIYGLLEDPHPHCLLEDFVEIEDINNLTP